MTIKTYPVLGRLLHDGKLYDPVAKPGVTIDLYEDEIDDIPAHLLGEPAATVEPLPIEPAPIEPAATVEPLPEKKPSAPKG